MKQLVFENNKAFLLLQSDKVNNGEQLKVQIKDVFSGYRDKGKHDAIFLKEQKVNVQGKITRISRVLISPDMANEFKKFKKEQIEKERLAVISANPHFIAIVDSFLESMQHQKYVAEMNKWQKKMNEDKWRVYYEENEKLREEMISQKVDRSQTLFYTPHLESEDKQLEILVEHYFQQKGLNGKRLWQLNADLIKRMETLKKFSIKEIHEKVLPYGGENGVDGYIDVTLSVEGGEDVRVVYRDVFDFGEYGYPKRLEGKNAFRKDLYTKDEIGAIDYIASKYNFELRM